MYFLTDKDWFPNPNLADEQGLLAVGGDLSPERLMRAYDKGIFPWYGDGEPILWWAPDPRMVFMLGDTRAHEYGIKVSKSLRQSLRNRGYSITWNTAFKQVMWACGETPPRNTEGTWVSEEMVEGYARLHTLGIVQSIEVWLDDELVGGLYGVDLKEHKIFVGESMFHTRRDASKVALYYLCKELIGRGYRLLDCQLPSAHLRSMGGVTLSRKRYLEYLSKS